MARRGHQCSHRGGGPGLRALRLGRGGARGHAGRRGLLGLHRHRAAALASAGPAGAPSLLARNAELLGFDAQRRLLAQPSEGFANLVAAVARQKPHIHDIACWGVSLTQGAFGEGTTYPDTRATDLLLAMSWQPAFCESKPSKTECRQLNDGLLPVTEVRLSLHGIWPQPNGNFYCGVPAAVKALDKPDSWEQLPTPALDDVTGERLAVAMPGTASHLDRHEWIKHGICFFGGRQGQAHFSASLQALDAVNGAGVADFLAARVGGVVTSAKLRGVFDQAFAAGAGERVQIQCKGDGAGCWCRTSPSRSTAS
jgi:ribonuclease I